MGCTRKHSNQAPHGSHERYATTNTPEQGRGPSGEGAARHRRVELYQRGIASVVGVSEHVHDSSRHCYSCGGRRIDRDADVVARPSWTSRTHDRHGCRDVLVARDACSPSNPSPPRYKSAIFMAPRKRPPPAPPAPRRGRVGRGVWREAAMPRVRLLPASGAFDTPRRRRREY